MSSNNNKLIYFNRYVISYHFILLVMLILLVTDSNPVFGFEQDFKVIQNTKSNLGQNWVNEFFYSIKYL